MKQMLLVTFIDFGPMTSGSSVRPQRMDAAFRRLGFEVDRLEGLQNRRRERWRRVLGKLQAFRHGPLPDFCYVEPPSGPFFNFCDHLLLIYLHRKRVPIGLFYRDAYWKAEWWPVHGLKRTFLTGMQRFDLFVFRHVCDVVFFPTQTMAELFDLPRKQVLPPAALPRVVPAHPCRRQALYVGGVSLFYGTDMLLKAFELLNERMQADIHLTVVCREREMGTFFDGYLGRPWLTVAHASGDAALQPFYEGCDIALYPGRKDFYMDFCMPVKLFEYLSRGLPVVCTDCRETARFVSRCGFGVVAKPGTEGYAEAVRSVFDEPGTLQKLRTAAVRALDGNLWEDRAAEAARALIGEDSLPANGPAATPGGRDGQKS